MATKAKDLHMQVKKLVRLIKERREEKFTEFLRFAGKFSLSRYSATNIWLIYSQKPDATFVAGMKEWNRLGRKIRKGERGIAILAPIVKLIEKEVESEIVKEEKVVGFKAVYVWDISQTEGREIKELRFAEPLTGNWNYKKYLKIFGVPVQEDRLYGPKGTTDGFTIFIEKKLSEAHKTKTLFHELVHLRYHFGNRKHEKTSIKELEAETAAMVICSAIGLDSSEYSLDYLSAWASEENKEIEKAIYNGFLYAREIIKTIREVEPDEVQTTQDIFERVLRSNRKNSQRSSKRSNKRRCLVSGRS
ncbi:ArdC-like ssDNA-binding domain-containing protein [Desulfurobacterium sp. TC5-1]|uniref:ArdC-like ssDNA-binding domain-containing protein n=1 Tax=Desulfurobacterium sp. TC5-1 TaxID=1158318 RepID=UPI0003B563FE|nr:ArdC-like ssDNA-binding domain-containing protein [Desulfurobacterium sp. TC5-1]